MQNNLLDLLPRFVMRDGTVVLPEMIDEICPPLGELMWTEPGKQYCGDFDDSDCRQDRQAPFRDKHGNRVFERDVANYGGLTAGIIKYDAIDDWTIRFDDGQVFRLGYGRLEVTGMIPYDPVWRGGNTKKRLVI